MKCGVPVGLAALLWAGHGAAATTAADIAARLEVAAQEEVLARADREGWANARVEVTLVRGSRPIEACSGPVEVQTLDARTLNRIRLRALCRPAEGAAPLWQRDVLVRTTVSAQVLVTTRALRAGELLGDGDVTLAQRTLTVDDALGDAEAAIGQAPRRALRSGDVVRGSLLQAPVLVRRGDTVRIVAVREQVSVSMSGEALDEGRAGALIRVRNLGSGKVLRARVTAAGEVQTVQAGAPMPHSRD